MNIQIETVTLKDGCKMDVIRDISAVEKLLGDKRRIDWLEQHTVSLEIESPRQYLRFGDIRAAIDAAAMPNAPAEPSRQ
jgi:hypothetical protein